jgi:LacI family transcriptional regulator
MVRVVRVVIKDVAKYAGVSVGTVSKYLNNPERLLPETKVKVEKAIEALQYKPSMFARSMRTRKSYTIAVIVPTLKNPFFAEMYSAIRIAACQVGYTPILFTTEDEIELIENYMFGTSIGDVDGIILCFLDRDEKLLTFLSSLKTNIPIVNIGWDINGTEYDSVAVDIAEGVYTAAKHLVDLGHKKIAFVGGQEDHQTTKEKYSGYARVMRDFGCEVKTGYVFYGNNFMHSGYMAARQFVNLPCPPSAIVTSNDTLAIGCLKYCLQKNIKIPEEMAVIGHDNIIFSEIYEPSLSTVAIPINEMAKEGVRLVMSKINKRRSSNRQVILKTNLVVRRSTNKDVPIEFNI